MIQNFSDICTVDHSIQLCQEFSVFETKNDCFFSFNLSEWITVDYRKRYFWNIKLNIVFTFCPQHIEIVSWFSIKAGVTFIYVNCISHCYNHMPSCIFIAWLESPDWHQKLCMWGGGGQRKEEEKGDGDWENANGEGWRRKVAGVKKK